LVTTIGIVRDVMFTSRSQVGHRPVRGRLQAVALAAAVLAPALAGCGGEASAVVAVAQVPPSTILPGATAQELAGTVPLPPTPAPTVPTTAEATTTTALQLPIPLPVPEDPYAPEAEVFIGSIEIPRLGLREDLRSGVTLTTLDKGPGHWPGTAMPGEVGNVVVAAHRVTHTRPFRHIDDLVEGDEVLFTMNDGRRVVYRTVRSEIVDDQAMWIVNQTPATTATLFACHPPGSARQRYVVHLELASESSA
jgi:sortase A